jgi:hypothetical protein
MQIDRDIIALPRQPPRHPEIVAYAPDAATLGKNDELVERGVIAQHEGCRRFDEIGQMCCGIRATQPADERRGEDDVADEPGPDEQNLQGSIVASSMSITGMSSLIG